MKPVKTLFPMYQSGEKKKIKEQIIQLHRLGHTARRIHQVLASQNVHISYDYLRVKVLPKLGLARKGRLKGNPATIRRAVVEETASGLAANASASAVRTAVAVKHQINVTRQQVLTVQKDLTPDLVAQRRTGRLQRRTYHTEGSNFQWHCDGYDKLTPYGFAIHGCVDGFSRMVIWLELGTTNKRPEQTCAYFLSAVETYGLPHTMRMDAGTENVNIAWAQNFLAGEAPRLTGLPPVIIGSSNHNERVERFWGLLRMQRMNDWIVHFKDLLGQGLMVAWDETDRKIAYYCYQALVRKDLDFMLLWHNNHKIRKQRNIDIPTGVPMIMHKRPQDYGLRDCTREVSRVNLTVTRDRLAKNIFFDTDLKTELDELCARSNMPYPPNDVEAADEMYRYLRREVHQRAHE